MTANTVTIAKHWQDVMLIQESGLRIIVHEIVVYLL